jgi:transposase
MGQKRTYKQYSKEYKEEAVALVREQGYSVPEAAKSLGLASNMLYRWKEQIESQLKGKSLSVDERDELKQLRKENKNLRMEKEILKKASAFFAREMKYSLTSSETNQSIFR